MVSPDLPEELIRIIAARHAQRGGPASYRPDETALLVIDMQEMFLAPGAPLEVPAARNICDNINRLASALRGAGGTVAWVYTTLPKAGSPRDWIYLSEFVAPERQQLIRSGLSEGHALHRLWRDLDPAPQDWRVSKDRFSAFTTGASELDTRLRSAGIANLLICGTLTNICCESTARDAMMLNYRVTIVPDANAARTERDHINGLWTAAQVFCDVADTRTIVDALSGTPAADAVAD